MSLAAQRFTTQFSPEEDRIKLLVERIDQEVIELALTRRLLNRLIPNLLARLESSSTVQKVPKQQSVVAQRFAQTAAVARKEKQNPVKPPSEAKKQPNAVLVTSINTREVKKGDGVHTIFVFVKQEKNIHRIEFGEQELRQWVFILFQQYSIAEWKESFWPKWIIPDALMNPEKPLN